MMDINAVIEHLGLNSNVYRLNQSVPPHQIIEWNGTDPQPTQQELESAWSEIEAHRLANEYKEKRRDEYLNTIPIGDQLDAILKLVNLLRLGGQDLPQDLDDVLGKWLAVKQKFPKPE